MSTPGDLLGALGREARARLGNGRSGSDAARLSRPHRRGADPQDPARAGPRRDHPAPSRRADGRRARLLPARLGGDRGGARNPTRGLLRRAREPRSLLDAPPSLPPKSPIRAYSPPPAPASSQTPRPRRPRLPAAFVPDSPAAFVPDPPPLSLRPLSRPCRPAPLARDAADRSHAAVRARGSGRAPRGQRLRHLPSGRARTGRSGAPGAAGRWRRPRHARSPRPSTSTS